MADFSNADAPAKPFILFRFAKFIRQVRILTKIIILYVSKYNYSFLPAEI